MELDVPTIRRHGSSYLFQLAFPGPDQRGHVAGRREEVESAVRSRQSLQQRLEFGRRRNARIVRGWQDQVDSGQPPWTKASLAGRSVADTTSQMPSPDPKGRHCVTSLDP